MTVFQAATGKMYEKQIIRLSPLNHYDEQTDTLIVLLVKELYKFNMDLTKDEEIDTLIKSFNAWKSGKLYNQPLEFKVERNTD